MTLTASGKFNDHELTGLPVLNPGGWFGIAWLIEIGGSYASEFFVVEAGSVQDALDEFVDHEEYGARVRIDIEADGADYGEECSPGTQIGGVEITEKCWINLKGEIITDPEKGKALWECSRLGNAGEPCDLDHCQIHGMEGSLNGEQGWPCRYHDEDFPSDGFTPKEYEAYSNFLYANFRIDNISQLAASQGKELDGLAEDHETYGTLQGWCFSRSPEKSRIEFEIGLIFETAIVWFNSDWEEVRIQKTYSIREYWDSKIPPVEELRLSKLRRILHKDGHDV